MDMNTIYYANPVRRDVEFKWHPTRIYSRMRTKLLTIFDNARYAPLLDLKNPIERTFRLKPRESEEKSGRALEHFVKISHREEPPCIGLTCPWMLHDGFVGYGMFLWIQKLTITHTKLTFTAIPFQRIKFGMNPYFEKNEWEDHPGIFYWEVELLPEIVANDMDLIELKLKLNGVDPEEALDRLEEVMEPEKAQSLRTSWEKDQDDLELLRGLLISLESFTRHDEQKIVPTTTHAVFYYLLNRLPLPLHVKTMLFSRNEVHGRLNILYKILTQVVIRCRHCHKELTRLLDTAMLEWKWITICTAHIDLLCPYCVYGEEMSIRKPPNGPNPNGYVDALLYKGDCRKRLLKMIVTDRCALDAKDENHKAWKTFDTYSGFVAIDGDSSTKVNCTMSLCTTIGCCDAYSPQRILGWKFRFQGRDYEPVYSFLLHEIEFHLDIDEYYPLFETDMKNDPLYAGTMKYRSEFNKLITIMREKLKQADEKQETEKNKDPIYQQVGEDENLDDYDELSDEEDEEENYDESEDEEEECSRSWMRPLAFPPRARKNRPRARRSYYRCRSYNNMYLYRD